MDLTVPAAVNGARPHYVDTPADVDTPEVAVVSDPAVSEVDRLLTAARTVLHRSGWWGFKVEVVLREAGLSTRSFYRHFQRKDELLMVVVRGEVLQAARNLAGVTDVDAPPEERVENYLTAMLDLAYRERLAKPAALIAARWYDLLAEYSAEMRACIEAITAPLARALADGRDAGVFPSTDPERDAEAIFHVYANVVAYQVSLPEAQPRATVDAMVRPFVLRAIGR